MPDDPAPTKPDAIPLTDRAAFARGVAAGRDPVNAEALAGGVGVTNLRSPWLQRPCGRCGHTFRRGDRVEAQPGPRFVHAPGTPICESQAPQSAGAPEREAFYRGLEAAFPPPEGA